jgi:hypothetical protein
MTSFAGIRNQTSAIIDKKNNNKIVGSKRLIYYLNINITPNFLKLLKHHQQVSQSVVCLTNVTVICSAQ